MNRLFPISPLLARYTKNADRGPSNSAQALADEIRAHFSKRISFPMLMGLIRRKGEQFVRETFQEVAKSDARNPLALFLWKIGRAKVVLRELP